MPIKDKEERKKYQADYHVKYYAKNGDKRRKQIGNRRKKIKEWYKEYKQTLKCNRCDENHPACIEFHHKGNKDLNISSMINGGYSIERILKEIEKCEILCANCHRKEHFDKYF